MKPLPTAMMLVTMLLAAPMASAADQATPDEAKAIAIKAVEYLKSAGPEKAFAEFDAKDGRWHDRDLYVTVLDSNGVAVAQGNNPGLVGKSVIDLRDVDGKSFAREMIAVKDASWVNFKWQNPVTKAVEPKTSYEVRVGEYGGGVGAYSK
jgi:cytochrome c